MRPLRASWRWRSLENEGRLKPAPTSRPLRLRYLFYARRYMVRPRVSLVLRWQAPVRECALTLRQSGRGADRPPFVSAESGRPSRPDVEPAGDADAEISVVSHTGRRDGRPDDTDRGA